MTRLPRFLAHALLIGLAALLAGCAGDPLDVPKACPQVRVDLNTADLRQYAGGDGRSDADLAWLVQVVGYEGACEYSDDGVDVTMDVDFLVTRGPAFTPGQRVDFHYFVAIPQYFPLAVGKQMFAMSLAPEGRGNVARVREENVRVFIPLEPRQTGASFDIYVGLQVPPDQLQENKVLTE